MTVCRVNRWTAILLAALLAAAWPASADEWTINGAERIVAISDIHGAYDAMVRTLQQAAVLDEELAWSGEKTHLVIIGDILDRGPDSRAAMDLLMRLEDEAAAAGGRVHVLIGNHEAMNLIGDLRYVSKEEYSAFAAEETPEERDRWFNAYRRTRAISDEASEDQRRVFDEQYPPGFFAHRRAFGSEGQYGRWLLTKPILVVIDGTAFVHGGLSPMIGEIGLQGVNETHRGEMVTYVRQVEKLINAELLLPTDSFYNHADLLSGFMTTLTTDADIAAAVAKVTRLSNSELHALEGPLWYRGNVACAGVIEIDRLEKSLSAIGAERVVIGHTPTRSHRIVERLGGRVIEVDTGMLNSYYEGQGNALVIVDGQASVVNENGEQSLALSPHERFVGRRPVAGLGATAIEQLMAGGDIVASREDASGRKIVSVSDGDRTIDAVFVKRGGRGFYPEVAAYRLDRLLELGMVPVSVTREVDGKDGSLQFLPANTTDETQRRETGLGGSAMCPLLKQWDAMLVFDTLIFNEARVPAYIQYDQGTWQLILVGHDKSFATSKARPRHLTSVALDVGPSWKNALSSLSDERLEERLGDVLDDRRLRALGARRDLLLQTEQSQ